jgi:hypothetical protein
MARYTRESSWKQRCNTLELDRLQHDIPAAFVIAQQYSFAKFMSLRFHSRKEALGASFKYVIISSDLVLKKLPKIRIAHLQTSKSEFHKFLANA